MDFDFEGEIIEGYFVNRPNRFIAEVEIDGEIEIAHVPNTGRMKELLLRGAKVLLRRVSNPERKTKLDLLMVYKDYILIAIDSKIPNILLYRGFKNGKLDYFHDYNEVKSEVIYGNSRLDIGLLGNHRNTLIEAKCVTLVKNQVAMFPDAPTERGARHVNELIHAKKNNFDAGIFFIVQRQDAKEFKPNWSMDPIFSEALLKAHRSGVVIKAISCIVTPRKISLSKELELRF